MNHFISAACCSLDRVEGWNSASIHFLASASPAHAFWPEASAATARATAFNRNFIFVSSDLPFDDIDTPAGKVSAGRTSRKGYPLRITSASNSIEIAKPIQIEGSCSRPNQAIILSLTATNARFT